MLDGMIAGRVATWLDDWLTGIHIRNHVGWMSGIRVHTHHHNHIRNHVLDGWLAG